MLFNSYVFILAFLPVTLAGYFLLNRAHLNKVSHVWLTIASLIFYAWFNFWYLFIIVISILFNFFWGRLLLAKLRQPVKKLLVWVGVLLNLGVLGYYKYFDFFLQNLNMVLSTDFTMHNILLPLGISFFTFQQLSYVIDCYRGEAERYGFIEYALFVSFFPQLIAGPIVMHSELVPQFRNSEKQLFNIENFTVGLMGFSRGLAKKVLLADSFGRGADWGYQNISSLNIPSAVIVVLCYTLQIYIDFSGYCDMATGLARMFNITLPQNFNSPYKSITVAEFWKRWHMTLTRFFTKYVYIPLGGNRKGKVRRNINTMIVFLLSGLWHGANWTFVLWGAINGIAVIVSNQFKKGLQKIPKVIHWAITFGFINIAWILFRAESLKGALEMCNRLVLSGWGTVKPDLISSILPGEILKLVSIIFQNTPWASLVFVILMLLATVVGCVFMKNTTQRMDCFTPKTGTALWMAFLFVWSILSFSRVSIFLYFNF